MRQKIMLDRRLLPAAIAALVLALAAPALAAQMDAREAPQVSGPLTLENSRCKSAARKYEGAVVARARVCLFLYAFDPGSETDAEDDYRVLWAQSTVNAVNGWCTTKTVTEVVIPADLAIHATAPADAVVEERAMTTTTLDVTAGDAALESGSLAKEHIAHPGEIQVIQKVAPAAAGQEPQPETQSIRLTWKGAEDQKLGFALGVEVSQPMGADPPPIAFGVRYPLQQTTC